MSFDPDKRHEWNLFTCVNLQTIEHSVLSTSQQMISTALSSWGQNIREHVWVLASPQHGGLWRKVCYAKIAALQLAIYQRLCLNGCFMLRCVFLQVLLKFFVMLHFQFSWIYNVPRDTAVLTVRYDTEVDKLKLKLDRLSLEIMTISFK